MSALMGFVYSVFVTPEPRDTSASRASLQQFQSNPLAQVQGRGTLVVPRGAPGSFWNPFQAQQLIVRPVAVENSITGRGYNAGSAHRQALTPDTANINAMG